MFNWQEENGVITFSVTSNGLTGEAWITRLERGWCRLSEYAKQVLQSSSFVPTNGVTTEVAVLKGSLFKDVDRITRNIRTEADKRQLGKPNAEVACLIREKFTDEEIEEMVLWGIVTAHEPINDSGVPRLLCADRLGFDSWLYAYDDGPDNRWLRDHGFAFVAPQVGT